MVRYSNAKGLVLKLGSEYPVYNNDDKVVGNTAVGDIAVVTYDDKDSYFEAVLATGKYAGYDGLGLAISDLKRAEVIVFEDVFDNGCVYLRDIKLNLKGEQRHVS